MAKEVIIHKKYSDFSDILFKKLAIILPEDSDIINHIIALELGKYFSSKPIYSLGLVKFKTLKTYIILRPAWLTG